MDLFQGKTERWVFLFALCAEVRGWGNWLRMVSLFATVSLDWWIQAPLITRNKRLGITLPGQNNFWMLAEDTPGTWKDSPFSLKGGKTKYIRQKVRQMSQGWKPFSGRESKMRRSFKTAGNPLTGVSPRGGRPKSRASDHQRTPDSMEYWLTKTFPKFAISILRPNPTQRLVSSVPDVSHNTLNKTGTQFFPLAERLPKAMTSPKPWQAQRHPKTYYWTHHCLSERQDPATYTSTNRQIPPTMKPSQGTGPVLPRGTDSTIKMKLNFPDCRKEIPNTHTQWTQQSEKGEKHVIDEGTW